MEWKEFKKDVSNVGILTWTFEEPSKSVNFLDLTILIEENEIVTNTYQKALSLYQYIIPLYNNPPKMIEDITYILLRKYKKEYLEEDYLEMATLLFHRRVRRGRNHAQTKEHILQGDMRLHREP